MNGDLKRLIKLLVVPILILWSNLKRFVNEIIWIIKRFRLIKEYKIKNDFKGLNIGCGENRLAGWLNADFFPNASDVIFLDATQNFPFEDNLFDYIFAEHMIEHISFDQGFEMLNECYRVLKPGGRIRIATPDLLRMIELFSSKKTEEQNKYIDWFINKFSHSDAVRVFHETFVLNKMVREWGHMFIYDEFALSYILIKSGFKSCERFSISQSNDKNLIGIDGHNDVSGYNMNAYETLVVEAVK
jgi:predicted SAM-dependent methyltransferase